MRGMGLASENGVVQYLRALEEKGFVQVQPGKARGIIALASPTGDGLARADGRTLYIDVELKGDIQAGLPADVHPQAGHKFPVDAAHMGLTAQSRPYALRVRGSSMIGVGILDGDCVVLDAARTPRSGDVVAALVDGEATLKTLVVDGSRSYLKAANPDYPDPVPVCDLEVQGVMVGLLRGSPPNIS